MPLYEYECENQHRETEQRKMEDRNDEMLCPKCGHVMRRVMSAPSGSFPGAANWRS